MNTKSSYWLWSSWTRVWLECRLHSCTCGRWLETLCWINLKRLLIIELLKQKKITNPVDWLASQLCVIYASSSTQAAFQLSGWKDGLLSWKQSLLCQLSKSHARSSICQPLKDLAAPNSAFQTPGPSSLFLFPALRHLHPVLKQSFSSMLYS